MWLFYCIWKPCCHWLKSLLHHQWNLVPQIDLKNYQQLCFVFYCFILGLVIFVLIPLKQASVLVNYLHVRIKSEESWLIPPSLLHDCMIVKYIISVYCVHCMLFYINKYISVKLCYSIMIIWMHHRNFLLISIHTAYLLTHWGRVTHICVSIVIIIGSDNGLLPGQHQAIIWTNAGTLLIGPLGINLSEILIS